MGSVRALAGGEPFAAIDAALRRLQRKVPAIGGRPDDRAADLGADRHWHHVGADRRRRPRGRAARHMARSARVCGRAVERVLAEDAERDLVGNGLADKGRAGVEQGLYRPGMPLRNRVRAHPIGVAAAGRTAGDIEQILGREGQPGERPAGAALDAKPLPRDEGADVVRCQSRRHLSPRFAQRLLPIEIASSLRSSQ